VERGADGDPVEEAMHRHPAGAEQTHMLVTLDRMASFVADMQEGDALEQVEGEEADAGEQHRVVQRAESARRLGRQVEERGPDPDAGAERDDQAKLFGAPQGDDAAGERRYERGGDDGQDGHSTEPMRIGLNIGNTRARVKQAVSSDDERDRDPSPVRVAGSSADPPARRRRRGARGGEARTERAGAPCTDQTAPPDPGPRDRLPRPRGTGPGRYGESLRTRGSRV